MSADTRQAVYPLPRTEEDPRFNIGLLSDLRHVLAKHGYPKVTEGRDIIRLQQALFGFLYGTAEDRALRSGDDTAVGAS